MGPLWNLAGERPLIHWLGERPAEMPTEEKKPPKVPVLSGVLSEITTRYGGVKPRRGAEASV